ncbi:hypothetical protein H072_5231 [Dactylellina haptotyla CBS 200.50]|uniref:Ecp2 effector protein domain-containing protein n=1 Tax=Dactylellina haptotyla (strain CBS 200.50) TaxID=1284197 RepID=S8AD15_DACHA|nr:hypothetical protein H072_5231 [Dactylellina haptotyla CBS 200.50]
MIIHFIFNILLLGIHIGPSLALPGGEVSKRWTLSKKQQTDCEKILNGKFTTYSTNYLPDQQFQCSFQRGNTLGSGGANIQEFMDFMVFIHDSSPNWNATTFTLDGALGAKCQQVACIGNYATLKICDNSLLPTQKLSWSGQELSDIVERIFLLGWPDASWVDIKPTKLKKPTVVADPDERWAKDSSAKAVDTWSCCSDYTKKNLQPKMSDRITGASFLKGDPNVQVVIQAASQSGTKTCDPTKNVPGKV